MDFVKFSIALLFLFTSLSFTSRQTNAAPLNNETEQAMADEIQELKQEIVLIWNELNGTNDRLYRLENEDSHNCNESATEEIINYEVMGVKIREGDDDEDDDDDDEEEEKNGERKTKMRMEELLDEIEETRHQRRMKGNKHPRGQCSYKHREDYRGRTAPEPRTKQENISASCAMRPNKALPPDQRLEIYGKILLIQKDAETLDITVKIGGMAPLNKAYDASINVTTKHGFHVHQSGNLSNGCESAGPHYNPFNNSHGGPKNAHRHLGDFGNLESDLHGNIDSRQEFKITKALTGPNSLMGRAIVIHALEDDLGSNPNDNGSRTTGNAGPRLACCVIKPLP